MDEIETEFRPCVGLDGYEISREGIFRNARTQRPLKAHMFSGYPCVRAHGGHHALHRLVALTFIGPPPTPDAIVNHIDGKVENYKVANLEWMTQGQNVQHAWDNGLRKGGPKNGTQVETISSNGVSTVYPSMNEAARALGADLRGVTQAVDKGTRSCMGHRVRRVDQTREGEEWREFNTCDGKTFKHTYSVSDQGRVKGPRGLMHPETLPTGYANVGLQDQDGRIRNCLVQRLVATAFLGPPEPNMVADHINTKKLDNRAVNLQWITQQVNTIRARGRAVVQKDAEGEVIEQFASLSLAAVAVDCNYTAISKAIKRGIRCRGFHWEFVEVDP